MTQANLPTGTVTFLLSDVEGSTRAWELEPPQMSAAMARHDALIESVVVEHKGQIVRPRGEGDSRFAVFARASDGIGAAAAIQQAFSRERWSTRDPLRVRIGLHTGESELRAGDYYGRTVNRCARLRAVAHGGQVVMSAVTADLGRRELAQGIELRDLGQHRLKDLGEPEHIFQLVLDGLSSEFPPLASMNAHRHNLAVEPTPLIGRTIELEASRRLLLDPSVRLVTITGTGGIGKTRLASQVGADLVDAFPDGVFMVSLAALAEPAEVMPTIARYLGVREQGAVAADSPLASFLKEKALLLVLDNFEHLLPAGAAVAGLLRACARLKVLATSRAPLRIYGEHELPLPPLSLPPIHAPSASDLSLYEAPRLFVERARAVRPEFDVSDSNARIIAAICARLDGVPLAIELAAARVKLLPLENLYRRLEHRLQVLVGGPRDWPTRQQRLRDTIAWSYNLLEPDLQVLFRRLGVFVGGWTLDGAEAVCALPGEILDQLAALVDASLVREFATGVEQPRFGYFEAIHEYALEHLAATDDLEPTQVRRADYFINLGEQAAPQLEAGAQYSNWLRALAAEQENLRATMHWCVASGHAVRGLRLAAALWRYWYLDGTPPQVAEWLQLTLRLLDMDTNPSPWRARAMSGAGVLFAHQQLLSESESLQTAGLAMARELQDGTSIASCLHNLGYLAMRRGELGSARAYLEEALRVADACGNRGRQVVTLNVMAAVAEQQSDWATAIRLYADAARLCEELGDAAGLAGTLGRQGLAAALDGDLIQAERLCERAVPLTRDAGNEPRAWTRIDLAQIRFIQGRYGDARALCLQALGSVDDSDQHWNWQSAALRGLACIASAIGEADQALRLFGAVAAIQPMSTRRTGVGANAFDDAAVEFWTATAAAAVPPEHASSLIAAGQQLSFAQTLAELKSLAHSFVAANC
jgi:predicted ATPase/class 3 adenylate cyclase